MLVANPRGDFSFIKGISPYSAGAVASPGFQVEHARFLRPLPLAAGFEAVDAHLKRLNRPRHALCGMELRSPRPFTFAGFGQFNAGYVETLKKWDIPRDGLNPVARTNIAPAYDPPSQPSVYGFSYTIPAPNAPKTFIVAGAGELPEGSLDPRDVVRRGETSLSALAEKAMFVM
ncbi:MAG: RidA family protein, partial [Bryobacterales bacterium]|nr:RidA family protein [Bryobacterales bacterium]